MKGNKILSILGVATVLSLLVVSVSVTPTLGTANRNLECTPTHGRVGDMVEVYGEYWDYTDYYQIIFAYGTTFKKVVKEGMALTGRISASFTVPECPQGTYTIKVETVRESATNAFRVEPRIDLDKLTGFVGENITVHGTGFAANNSVTIYFDNERAGSAQTDSVGSFTNVTFIVSESYGGTHTVKAEDKSDNSGVATFTTKQSLVVTPTSGVVGEKVVVGGTGFQAGQEVTLTFGGDAVTTNPSRVTTNAKGTFGASFDLPGRAPGVYEVKARDGTYESRVNFTLSAGINLTPASGYVGIEITIRGVGFQPGKSITIVFDDTSVATATADASGKFTANFTVPSSAVGTHKVKASDGTNTAEADFHVATSASISPVTSVASPGHVGAELTVSGVGFVAGKVVTITYDGSEVATATIESDGTFSATFLAPASSSGLHTVTATIDGITNPLTFVMESTPPAIPVLKKPETGARTGAKAYFDWEDVTELSGVTYTLQIATEEDFSPASIALEKKGFTKSEYTIIGEDRLKSLGKDSPYYWRVKAVDGATNEGGWSGTDSFYVAGFALALPQWAIYLLLGIGVLLFGILGFWLGRRTAYY